MKVQAEIIEADEVRDKFLLKTSPEDLRKFIKENRPEVDLFDGSSSRLYDKFRTSFLDLDREMILDTLENQGNLGMEHKVSIFLRSNRVVIHI